MAKSRNSARSSASGHPREQTPAKPGKAAEPSGEAAGSKPAPGLYVVPTPIGNMRDITLRALDILQQVDLIACEDTRVTGRLLDFHGITTPVTAYHDHNAPRVRPELLRRAEGGASIALVSDAGTPLISDPGYRLVQEAVAKSIAVTALPGASAVMTALTASGLPTDRFLFLGFPPSRASARKKLFGEVASVQASLVFFESARRLAASLGAMAVVFRNRDAVVARELTKRYEELRRDTLPALAKHYTQAGPPKGEVVVIVGPPGDLPPPGPAEIDRLLRDALKTQSMRDAVSAVSDATGVARREVYDRGLALTGRGRR